MLDLYNTPLWQDESYDHLVRDGEFDRIRRYIENSPTRAGIVMTPEFPWSSAGPRRSAAAGQKP